MQKIHLNCRQSTAQNLLIRNTQTSLKLIDPYFVIANFDYPLKFEGDADEQL